MHTISRILSALLILTLLAACAAPPQPAAPTPTAGQPPAASPTAPPPPTRAVPTLTPSPAPSPTATLTPARSIAALWNLYDPTDIDERATDGLLVSGEQGYHLDPDWLPVRIEYFYSNHGMGAPVLDYHTIRLVDGVFMSPQGEVSLERVQAFMDSLNDLQPVGSLLGGYSHTDDYPTWRVAITAPGGDQLMLESSSTGNPGSGPWNVIYNGRIFAQYSAALAVPLSDLFPAAVRSPASAGEGGRPEPRLIFSTRNDPFTILGFSGLLPLVDDFHYSPDLQTGSLSGWLERVERIDGRGELALTGFNQLITFTIQTENGAQECEISPTSGTPPPAWEFFCRSLPAAPGQPYRYPVTAVVIDSTGRQASFDGVFYGRWEDDAPAAALQPLPPALESALWAHPDAADLLADHFPARAAYLADFDKAGASVAAGEVILLGAAILNGKTVPYSVGTPFTIENGVLTRWDLTRADLDALLADVANQAITMRVQLADPQAHLNLWFARKAAWPEFPNMIDGVLPNYASQAQSCGDLPGWALPAADQPLRAFDFDHDWSRDFHGAGFVLLPDGARVEALTFNPHKDISAALLPPTLGAWENTPFNYVQILGSGVFGGTPALQVNPSPVALEQAVVLFEALPGVKDMEYSGDYLTEGLVFLPDEVGVLQAVGCHGSGSGSFSQASPDGVWQFNSYPAGGDEKYGYAEISGPRTHILRYDPAAYPYPKLATDGRPHPVHWSADGRLLYYTLRPDLDGQPYSRRYYDGANLYSLNLENGKTEAVLEGGLMSVAFSPNDKYIAYTKRDDAPIKLRIVPRTGGGKAITFSLTLDDINAGGIVWSPDGMQLLLAIDTREDTTSLLLATLDGKKLEGVRILENDERRLVPQAWLQPDRALLYDYTNQAPLWLVIDGALLAEGPQITPIP